MKPELTRSSWDDLIFESRNREYGAYPIRKSYDDSIAKGFFTALLFAAFVFGAVQVASLLHIDVKAVSKPSTLTKITDLPIIIREQIMKKQEIKSEKVVNKNLVERIVTHEVVTPPQSNVAEPASNGTESVNGTDATISDGADNIADVGTIPVATELPKILDTAEIMPQYEGGLKAMVRFLSKNVHYPGAAKNIGLEGIVYVRFVINNNGEVVDVQVIKGVSALLDNEAMRVVALMTKWRPGTQHGIPVNVRMVLPIKFQIEQQ